jgi:hypothetical protein
MWFLRLTICSDAHRGAGITTISTKRINLTPDLINRPAPVSIRAEQFWRYMKEKVIYTPD